MNFRPRIISEDDFKKMQRDAQGDGKRGHGIRVNNHSVGDPLPKPTYKSKWEAAYASKLDLEQKAGEVKRWWYEPFSIWLPGKVRYKPDFLVEYTQGISMELVEVKGWSKNRRDGMTRLKIAAALFPCFVWRLVYRQGNGWSGEYV